MSHKKTISFHRTGFGVLFFYLFSITFYLQLFGRQCRKGRKANNHESLNNTYLKSNFNFIIYYLNKYLDTTISIIAHIS